jgi:hypothetical protein
MTFLSVAEHLRFRSANGSLALGGLWMVLVGTFMVAGSIANILGRGPARKVADRVPRAAMIAWGVLGVIAGAAFIAWPFFATPGKLY